MAPVVRTSRIRYRLERRANISRGRDGFHRFLCTLSNCGQVDGQFLVDWEYLDFFRYAVVLPCTRIRAFLSRQSSARRDCRWRPHGCCLVGHMVTRGSCEVLALGGEAL